jgi:glycerol kinase
MAPIAISLRTYGAELSWKTNLYIDTLFSNTHLQWWLDQAQDEFEDMPLDKAS